MEAEEAHPSPDPEIHASWKRALSQEFPKSYFVELVKSLRKEKASGHVIYPPGKKIFTAFDYTPLEEVKVVIIGQDPYHGPGQANGLCFSVERDTKIPPSLRNIYKELHADIGCPIPDHGDLSAWAKQGVLMLNAMLTVRAHEAGSHQKLGWQHYTDAVIKTVSERREGVVFILWGNFAQGKESLIDSAKHCVIKSVHPSPLSASRGFFGSQPFSKANEYLSQQGSQPVDWDVK